MTPHEPTGPSRVDVERLLVWCRAATTALREARAVINRLNVFPVPDSDTGTNLHLTMEGATEALESYAGDDVDEAVIALARGALVHARGNSGSILAQLLRAAGRAFADSAADVAAVRVADALSAASRGAYEAVATPVEGTMLTVMASAAEAAEQSVVEARGADDLDGLTSAAVAAVASQAAQVALVQTSSQLEVLRRAGVVDAGAQGLCLVLDVLADVLAGGEGRVAVPDASPVVGAAHTWQELPTEADLVEEGPAYEVMYLLEAEAADVARLRERLDPLGDSLVVVGGEGLWSVHVHVDDVGAAVEAAVEAGRPFRIKVTHFVEQERRQRHDSAGAVGRTVVACAAGPGIGELFKESGAVTVPVGPGRRVTAARLLEAVLGTETHEVIVLPNEFASISTAEAAADAARAEGLRVTVIPTRAQVQGLAALAVRDASLLFDDEVAQMSAAAGHARAAAITFATKDAMTMAGPCREGQCLGAVDGDFVVVGDDADDVGRQVLDRVSGGNGELVTMLVGAPDSAGDGRDVATIVDGLVAYAQERLPLAEVVVLDGGQQRYPVLLGVE